MLAISSIQTITCDAHPNLCWVLIETNQGITGLGETYFGAESVSAYIHETAAPYLLGKNPLAIDKHSQALDGLFGFNSISAEVRAASAIDIALWDIFGQVTKQPLYQLLGGKTHDKLRLYNTCAGYGYNRKTASPDFNLHSTGNLQAIWGVGANEAGPYEDLEAFHQRPAQLAQSLLSEGITAMKIWPFDQFAERYNGQWIDNEDLDKGVQIFRDIREAVGNKMEIALELHLKWSLPAAKRIAAAVEAYDPLWFEDPIKVDNLDTLLEFKRSTRVPVAASELLATRRQFLPLLEKRAADFVIVDLAWCGGISEAKKIATMAEAHHLPVMAHDCTGPVALMANVHFSTNIPNAFMVEFVRAYYSSWYPEIVTQLPPAGNGWIQPPDAPGLGTKLRSEFLQRPDVHVRSSAV